MRLLWRRRKGELHIPGVGVGVGVGRPLAELLAFTELTASVSPVEGHGEVLGGTFIRQMKPPGRLPCVHQADALPPKDMLGEGRLLGVRGTAGYLVMGGGGGHPKGHPRLQRSPSVTSHEATLGRGVRPVGVSCRFTSRTPTPSSPAEGRCPSTWKA